MSTTIGSHAVAGPFTNPQNGQSPMDADVVRTQDESVRAALVAHDADAGLHVQSGLVAARPAASAATGGVYAATDDVTNGPTLARSDGTAWLPLGYVHLDASRGITGNLKGDSDNARDVGTAGLKWRTGYFGTSVVAPVFDANAIGGVYRVNGTQVLAARRTGWQTFGTDTLGAIRNCNSLVTGTVTTSQLASIVDALLVDLLAHGILGP